MEIGYARVSTTKQDLARQLDALAAAARRLNERFAQSIGGTFTVFPSADSEGPIWDSTKVSFTAPGRLIVNLKLEPHPRGNPLTHQPAKSCHYEKCPEAFPASVGEGFRAIL